MAYKEWIVALSVIVTASAVSANPKTTPIAAAPTGTPETRYCLRVEPVTGSLLETVQCWTREEWADQDVDVDKAWAKDGVRVEG